MTDLATLHFLRRLPLFAGLEDHELAEMADCCSPLDMEEGLPLFEQGDRADAAYLIRHGMLRIEMPLAHGNDLLVARVGPDSVVGEPCLVEPGERSMRAVTGLPTQLLRLDRAAFTRLRALHRASAYKVIRNASVLICERLRDTTDMLQEEWGGLSSNRPPSNWDATGPGCSSERVPTPLPELLQGGDGAWSFLRRMFGRADA